MNDMTLFNYEGNEVRVITKNGEPWWVAIDVCKILGLKSDAYKRLDEDEKGSSLIRTLGGDQQMAVVSEAGLNTLVIRCRKPEAKPFIRWITHSVLPSIRKTGMYIAPTAIPVSNQSNDLLVQQAEMFLALAKRQSTLEAQILENETVIQEMKQVVEEVKDSTNHETGWFTVVAYARKLGVYMNSQKAKSIGGELYKYCKAHGIKLHKVSHPTLYYGVNEYPVEVLSKNSYLFR